MDFERFVAAVTVFFLVLPKSFSVSEEIITGNKTGKWLNVVRRNTVWFTLPALCRDMS